MTNPFELNELIVPNRRRMNNQSRHKIHTHNTPNEEDINSFKAAKQSTVIR